MKWLAIIFVFLVPAASAQVVGDCARGTAEADLDVGDVLARVFNGGNLFFGNSSAAAYLVPKNSDRSPIFFGTLWMGGKVDGELRVAATNYADNHYWPGPLDENGRAPEDCSEYDRIFNEMGIDPKIGMKIVKNTYSI